MSGDTIHLSTFKNNNNEPKMSNRLSLFSEKSFIRLQSCRHVFPSDEVLVVTRYSGEDVEEEGSCGLGSTDGSQELQIGYGMDGMTGDSGSFHES